MVRKALAVMMILAALLSPAAISEEASGMGSTEAIGYTSEAEEARAYADDLQERFGITILLGDECQGAIQTQDFSIGNQAPMRSPLMGMLGMKGTVQELKKLEEALEKYPPELFSMIRDEQAPNGVRFLIADQIVDSNPEMSSIGYAICDSSYYNAVLAYLYFEQSTVHHELWHLMEMHILAKYPDAFLIWDALNPDGFQYTEDYAANTDDYDGDYFARGYGMVNAREDRATIAEAVFSDNRNEWFAGHPAIKRKLDAMNLALKDTLIIQYNVKEER